MFILRPEEISLASRGAIKSRKCNLKATQCHSNLPNRAVCILLNLPNSEKFPEDSIVPRREEFHSPLYKSEARDLAVLHSHRPRLESMN
jgi:hypothetical protein